MRLSIIIAFLFCAGCSLGDTSETPEALGTTVSQPIYVAGAPGGADVRLAGGASSADPIHLQVNSNSSDASYRTTWTLDPNSCLAVTPRVGESEIVTGAPIVADYYHFGRILGVAIGTAPSQRLVAFVEPVRFETIACPGTAP